MLEGFTNSLRLVQQVVLLQMLGESRIHWEEAFKYHKGKHAVPFLLFTPGPLGPSPGAFVALSILRGRPLTSLPARFLTALIAVSASSYSQNPNPLGFPVLGSWTNLRRRQGDKQKKVETFSGSNLTHFRLTTGPTSESAFLSCSSVVSKAILATSKEEKNLLSREKLES